MATAVSEAVKLYGTDEPVEPRRQLVAGPLTAEFDQGALRFIKVNGVEAIRNIGYVVRDKDWGTYGPSISNLKIDQASDSFSIGFDAVCSDQQQQMHYTISITGAADGTLRFSSSAKTDSDFLTNRIGFMVLHPIAGIAGQPVAIEHTDGSIDNSEFPVLVDPVQPFMDIRCMTHEVVPGLSVACRLEGDVFETEDQRQWNDASYKTYSRPIALPWPYTIPQGEEFDQSVTLSISGKATETASESTGPCLVSVGESAGKMPQIGMGLEPQHTDSALQRIEIVEKIGVQFIICWHDLRAGHGVAELGKAKALAAGAGADLVLEAVIPCEDYEQEIALVASQASEAGVTFAAVSFSPADYLMSIMPGSGWPEVPALADIYDTARKHFPGVTLGGGMFAFFPELNRFRPPTDHLDYITHTSNTITHACDDHTVTENLEALPQVIFTCRSFSGGKPYRLGPSSIGMRFNPYGSKTMDNPDNTRIAMARMEPRQRGLLNAAWTIGYLAHAVRGEIDAVALHAPTGEFGLVYHQQDWQQPGFDGSAAQVYPAYHALRGIATAAGSNSWQVSSSNSHDVEALCFERDGKKELWIANLTANDQQVRVEGMVGGDGGNSICRLNAESFSACVDSADGFSRLAGNFTGDSLVLSAYEVVCIS